MIAKNPYDYVGYLSTGFFGLCVIAFIWKLNQPGCLEISPRGVSWFDGRKTHEFTWADFAVFRAYRPTSRNLSKHVGFEHASNCSKRGKLSGVARALAGVDGSFGGQWEISSENLAELLNWAKEKWR